MILLHRFHPRHRGLIIIARDICVFVRTFVRYARLLLQVQVIIGRVVVRGGGFVFSRGILWWEARLFQEGLHVVGGRKVPSGQDKQEEGERRTGSFPVFWDTVEVKLVIRSLLSRKS